MSRPYQPARAFPTLAMPGDGETIDVYVADHGGFATTEEIAAVNRALREEAVRDGEIMTIAKVPQGRTVTFDGTTIGAGDTLTARGSGGKWEVLVNGKPTQLAAGQVWEIVHPSRSASRITITGYSDRMWRDDTGGGWATGMFLLTDPSARYLGTREEVAAREALRPLSIAELDAIADAVACELCIGGGLVEAFNDGERVAVEAVGCSMREITYAIDAARRCEKILEGRAIVARADSNPPARAERREVEARERASAPAPTLANGPHPHVAQPHDCRTAGDHAGAMAKHVLAAPSPRAPRAAVSPSLVAWQELPHFWRRWAT